MVASLWGTSAHGQLRVVSYNTLTGSSSTATPRDGMDIVLTAIGEQQINGIAQPIDILLLQEQYSESAFTAVSAPAFANLLNSIYGEGIYDHGVVNGLPFGTSGGAPAVVYNTQTVELIQENRLGSPGPSGQPRSTMRYRFQPIGYSESAQLVTYNDHYKAGDSGTDADRRNAEAIVVRDSADSLGDGAHIIYAGDHNFYTSSEAAFQTLISDGPGQALDPVERIGSWSENAGFADVHTQSPCLSGCVGSPGGLDDRFDFQLVTNELLDGEGLSYLGPSSTGLESLEHSYHAFGNNGSTYNNNITATSNSVTFPGVTSYSKSQILSALRSVSDHLPVVADYQVPAQLAVSITSLPETLAVGEDFSFELTVWNAADVVAEIGADELDYALRAQVLNGALLDFSAFFQLDMALGGGNVYEIQLDTSTPGMKTDALEVASGSPGVEFLLCDVCEWVVDHIEIPINYEVLAAELYGDYNGDDVVDAADYTMWRDALGSEITLPNEDPTASPGLVDMDDYDVWAQHFGETLAAGAGALAGGPNPAVPEPSSLVLLATAACLLARHPATLMAWTRAR